MIRLSFFKKSYNLSLLFLSLFFLVGAIDSETNFLSLEDKGRSLNFQGKPVDEIFLCQSESKKTFGKNGALTSECYAIAQNTISNALTLFLEQPRTEESQFGFYTTSGKQIHPEWEEEGYGRLALLSFVITNKQQLFVQVVRKDKAYFFLRTIPGNWDRSE
ncbi:hypothetical protein LPTSP3_g29340 [Leptospira kobayashii]|uniref:Uncharacterized protein n=1 Tax=Leptospira kobayashii TaxID=1917830 RepID=A0ABN6KHH9_9LEPT|nr:hypothetical protein [Leptospira kobayashii]BDA80004.1 hypothetical protein LPTSP3_g29340 [Leptospira kobayashii]